MNTNLTITIISSVAAIVLAFLYGFTPKVRKKELDELKKKLKSRDTELINIYKDIQAFEEIEKNLCEELSISKQEARKGYTISEKCEPARIMKRIGELEDQLKQL